jgi:hypothetical protein
VENVNLHPDLKVKMNSIDFIPLPLSSIFMAAIQFTSPSRSDSSITSESNRNSPSATIGRQTSGHVPKHPSPSLQRRMLTSNTKVLQHGNLRHIAQKFYLNQLRDLFLKTAALSGSSSAFNRERDGEATQGLINTFTPDGRPALKPYGEVPESEVYTALNSGAFSPSGHALANLPFQSTNQCAPPGDTRANAPFSQNHAITVLDSRIFISDEKLYSQILRDKSTLALVGANTATRQLLSEYLSRFVLLASVATPPKEQDGYTTERCNEQSNTFHCDAELLDDAITLLSREIPIINQNWLEFAIAYAHWIGGRIVKAREILDRLLVFARSDKLDDGLSDLPFACLCLRYRIEYLDRRPEQVKGVLKEWEVFMHAILDRQHNEERKLQLQYFQHENEISAAARNIEAEKQTITFIVHFLSACSYDDNGLHEAARNHWNVIFGFAFREELKENEQNPHAESPMNLMDEMKLKNIQIWKIPHGFQLWCAERLCEHLQVTSTVTNAYESILEYICLYNFPISPFADLLSDLALVLKNFQAASSYVEIRSRQKGHTENWALKWRSLVETCRLGREENVVPISFVEKRISNDYFGLHIMEQIYDSLRNGERLNACGFNLVRPISPSVRAIASNPDENVENHRNSCNWQVGECYELTSNPSESSHSLLFRLTLDEVGKFVRMQTLLDYREESRVKWAADPFVANSIMMEGKLNFESQNS